MRSKAFTVKEKILLAILVGFLLTGFYAQIVYIPASTAIEAAEYEAQLLRVENDALAVKKMEMDEMLAYIEEEQNRVQGHIPELAQFDNLTNIMNQYNSIFGFAGGYSFTFGSPVIADEIARRSINMSFGADSYDAAKRILAYLEAGSYRCQISDLRIAGSGGHIAVGPVSVNATITYFEKR